MKTTTPILALLLYAGCGSPGDRPACTTSADCAPGTSCQQTTEGGVCWPANTLSLDAPAANALVGAAGVPVAATLVLGKAGSTAPATVELRAGAAPAGTLAKSSQTGTSVAYAGTYQPAPATNGAVALSVRATVALVQGTEQVASPGVTVRVDTAPPAIGAVTAACAGGCKRDGTLAVAAPVTDANAVTVSVSLSLAPADARPMTLSAGSYRADVALKDFPFPYFSQMATATVKATDAAGNEATSTADVPVTRLRWATPAEPASPPQLTGAAVDPTGRIIVGASNSKLYFYDPGGAAPTSVSVGSIGISAAPSVGPTAIWVGSEDGRVYAVKLDGSGILNGSGCNTGGSVRGTPALNGSNPEVAFAGSNAARLFAADTGATCIPSPLTDAFTAAPAVDRTGRILAATATATATATLRRYLFDGAFTPDWNVQVGVNVLAPVALDASDNAWTGSQDGKLNVTTPAGATTTLKTLGGSIGDSAIILANGDVVVGDQSKALHRFAPDGTQVWTAEPTLAGAVLAPLAVSGGDAALLVPTTAGTIHAIDGGGAEVWSATLSAGLALREGNIHEVQGSGISTAYFGCSDGTLYAVIVDGRLDVAAPWPKSHHDTRNTGNAAAPLP
jgi:hypothetical protein